MNRAIWIFVVALPLAACDSLALYEGGSAVVTGKSLSDQAISLASGKNCSTTRISQGLTYCVEDEAVPVQNLYCYRTLGEITCYDRPEYGDRQQKVGINDQNAVRKP
jgi:hypothetical protein